jgi:hypothetical protein
MNHIGFIGIRADENTAPTTWVKIEPDAVGLKPEHTRLESKRMSRGRFKKVGEVVRTIGNGDFGLEVDRHALLACLEAAGFDKTVENTTDYKLVPVADAKASKFCDIIIQDIDSGYETQFVKCKLDVSMALGADDYVRMTATVYATEIIENQSVGTYTAATPEAALWVKNTKIAVNGTQVEDQYSSMNLSLPIGASLAGAGSGASYFEYSEDVEHTADVQFNAFVKNDYFAAYDRSVLADGTTLVTTMSTQSVGEDVVITATEAVESVEKDNTASGKYKVNYNLNPDSAGATVSFVFKGMAS